MDLFRIGSQCGLKPDEVLDMSLDVFRACVKGYADSLFDKQVLTVQAGYWAAYFANSKHPKSVSNIITDMSRKHQQKQLSNNKNVNKPEVDVEAYLATEEQFFRRLQSK